MPLGPDGNNTVPGDESVDSLIGYKEEEFNFLLKRLLDLSRKNPEKVTKLFGDFLEELGTILNEDKNEERLEGNRSPVVTNQEKEQMMRSENTLSGTVKTLRKRSIEFERKIVKRKSFGKGRKDDKNRKRKGGKSKDKKINKSRKDQQKRMKHVSEMKKIKQKVKLIQEKNEELDVCTNLWVELTNLGLGVATALQKQVMDVDLVTKLTSLPGKFHTN